MWLLKDCIENIVDKGEIAQLSNSNFCHNVFLKLFSSICWNKYIWRKGLMLIFDEDEDLICCTFVMSIFEGPCLFSDKFRPFLEINISFLFSVDYQ